MEKVIVEDYVEVDYMFGLFLEFFGSRMYFFIEILCDEVSFILCNE